MKQVLVKLLGNVFLEKAKTWLKESGFTNVIYLTLAIGTLLLGNIPLNIVGLGFLKPYLVGGFFAVFTYINWNIIVKLYKTKVKPKLEDIKDDIL